MGYQDELDKAIKIFRDKVENHKNILDIDYQTSIKFRKFNAYKNLLNTVVTGTIPERIEKYKKKLDYVDEVVKKNKIKVEKKKEEKKEPAKAPAKGPAKKKKKKNPPKTPPKKQKKKKKKKK